MSSQLVRHSSFTLHLTHTPHIGLLCGNNKSSIPIMSVVLCCIFREYSTIMNKLKCHMKRWYAEWRELRSVIFGWTDGSTGHRTNGLVLISVIGLRDLSSLANQHWALGAIMTFTQTDYNFKWLFKKIPWWNRLRSAVVGREEKWSKRIELK